MQDSPDVERGVQVGGRTRRWAIGLLSSAIALVSLSWAAQLSYLLRLSFYSEQFLALMLALSLGLVFLVHPTSQRPNSKANLLDWGLSTLGIVSSLYVAIRYPILVDLVADPPASSIAVCTIILVLVLEGVRRTSGPILTGLAIVFLMFGLFGHFVPGQLTGRDIGFGDLALSLGKDEGVLGRALAIVSTIVVAFIFFGQILLRTGGSNFFTDISMAAMGRYRGGAAKISIVASSLFGAVSGSAVSNVVSTGVVTIPLMRRSGFPAETAAAVEATASTGGQLMPPILGAAAFLMAEFLQIPYTDVMLASILPAALYYCALFIQSDLEASKLNILGLDRARLPKLRTVFRDGWYFPFPFVVLIGGLFWLGWVPESAALYAAASLMVLGAILGYSGRRFTLSDLVKSIRQTGIVSLEIILIGALAGIIIGVINLSGLGFSLTLVLGQLGSSNFVLLLIVSALICIVLGMGMPTTGVYVLVSVLVAPAMVRVGVEALSAHFFVFYFGMLSMITPPVAIAAFAAASVANTNGLKVALKSVKFGWPAYIVPFLIVGSPSLLMKGSVIEVAAAGITALAGVACVCFALSGYFLSRINVPIRVAFLISGLALLIPPKAIPYGVSINIVGAVFATAIIFVCLLGRKNLRAQTH